MDEKSIINPLSTGGIFKTVVPFAEAREKSGCRLKIKFLLYAKYSFHNIPMTIIIYQKFITLCCDNIL